MKLSAPVTFSGNKNKLKENKISNSVILKKNKNNISFGISMKEESIIMGAGELTKLMTQPAKTLLNIATLKLFVDSKDIKTAKTLKKLKEKTIKLCDFHNVSKQVKDDYITYSEKSFKTMDNLSQGALGKVYNNTVGKIDGDDFNNLRKLVITSGSISHALHDKITKPLSLSSDETMKYLKKAKEFWPMSEIV